MTERDKLTEEKKMDPLDHNDELDFLLYDKPPPLTQAFYNKYNVRPPTPQISRAASSFVHSRQIEDHPFKYVNPNLMGQQLADNESSVERKSPSNSTYYSRGDSDFK